MTFAPVNNGSSSGAPGKNALAFIFVTMLLAVVGFGLLIPVLPKLVTRFEGGSIANGSHIYGILIGLYALMQFIASPILGALSDRYGRRRVILISLLGSSIDYLIMANAPSLAWLFVARTVSGLTAGVLATANAYVADVTPPEKRAQSFGLLGAAFGLGFIIGPLIGGALGSIDLRLPFWMAAGCSSLNWLYGFFVLPESLPPQNRRAFDFKRANPIGALLALKRFPTVRGLAESYFLLMLSQMMVQSTWVLYTDYRYHWGPWQVSISLAIVGAITAIVQSVLIRPVIGRLGEVRGVIAGFLLSIAAQILYALAAEGWVIYLVIPLGALASIAGPALQSYVTRHVPANEQGAVQGIYAGLASLAGIPGPLLAAWSFAWAIAPDRTMHLPGMAFFEGATLVLIALLLALRSFRADSVAQTLPAAARVVSE
jgi:DHA1 family tetracycline resistance protein-like MFS transporter